MENQLSPIFKHEKQKVIVIEVGLFNTSKTEQSCGHESRQTCLKQGKTREWEKNEWKVSGRKKLEINIIILYKKVIPKHGHLSQLLSQRRASCQVPQELDMLVSSALLSRICLHNSYIKQSTYLFQEAWIKGNIRSAISVRSVQPQFFVHLWMLEERNNQGCAPSQKADCYDSCKIWNLLCWILKLDPIHRMNEIFVLIRGLPVKLAQFIWQSKLRFAIKSAEIGN